MPRLGTPRITASRSTVGAPSLPTMTAPSSANTESSPGRTLGAPETISRGAPPPSSTVTIWSFSAWGCGRQETTFAIFTQASAAARASPFSAGSGTPTR